MLFEFKQMGFKSIKTVCHLHWAWECGTTFFMASSHDITTPLSERLHPLHSTKHVHRVISQLAPSAIHLTSFPLWLTPAPSLLLPHQGFWATVESGSLCHDSFPQNIFFTSTPTLLFPSSTHPSSVKQRNARVHSRINEVIIAGIQARVIAGPTPQKKQKKQKAVCLGGEPHKITEAF